MKFWLCASALATCAASNLLVGAPPFATSVHGNPANAPKRANELTLAGLRPGRDKLVSPTRAYKGLRLVTDSEGALVWRDPCALRELRVEVDSYELVETVTMSSLVVAGASKNCGSGRSQPRSGKVWRSGRGLALGDRRERVIQLYGPPTSSGPSTGHGRELELLFYAFDWAGSNVPQVMEVYCDQATGRVVEITLAAPSL